MKTITLKMTLLAIILNCSAAYARSSAYAENDWVNGFYFGQDAAAQRPLPGVPNPTAAEPAPAAQDTAAQLGPELTLQQAPRPSDPAVEIPDDLKAGGHPDYDKDTALRLAGNAKRHSRGAFTGWCYSYVADAMELAGIIRPGQWYSLGIGVDAAADFAAWANRNPGTLRSQLKLAKIPTPSIASELPMGAIVVYNRGTCGFSSRSGHIEVKVAPNQLCSDGCQPAYQECYGSPGVRAGISVYVPVKKTVGRNESKVCGLTGSGDGKCFYKCDDGSAYENRMKRPNPWNDNTAGPTVELCRQVVMTFGGPAGE